MNIMLDFQQKRKVRSFMYSRTTLVILFLILVLVVHSTWRVYQKKGVSEDLKNISVQYVEDLRNRNDELKTKIDRLETTSGIEEEIRSRFSVVKDKENMVVVVPNVEEAVSTTTKPTSFWRKIINFFGSSE